MNLLLMLLKEVLVAKFLLADLTVRVEVDHVHVQVETHRSAGKAWWQQTGTCLAW